MSSAARLADAPLPALQPDLPPWPGATVRVGGADVFVRHTPGGSASAPALYVHGLGGASTNWTDVAALLAPWLEGEALDLPGFGRSGPSPTGSYSIAAHARVVIDYVEQSGRGPVHLLGNSMGGAVSLRVAATRPDLVRTLTLISPAVSDFRLRRLVTNPRLALVVLPGVASVIMRWLGRISPDQRVQGVLDLCFADPSRVSSARRAQAADELRAQRGQPWLARAFVRSLRGIAASYLTVGSRSAWARAATVQVPTLVLWGAQDRLVSAALAPRLAATLPSSRLLVLPDAGHVAQLEQPTTTARAVLALLEDSAR